MTAIAEKMQSIGDRIREARNRAGMTLARLADEIGITPSSISQWEQGRTDIGLKNAVRLAAILNVSLAWLLNGEGPTDVQPVSMDPKKYALVVTRVAAGTWGDVITPQQPPPDAKYLELDTRPLGFPLALEIEGESMLPDFQPGDMIVIDTGLDPLPGDFVVAVLEGESQATFKKFRPRGADEDGLPVIELAPLNADYAPLTINQRNPGRIIGTLIEHRRYRRRR